jgi:hypothetical protein
VSELVGDAALEAVAVTDQAGTRRVVSAKALFIFIGAAPCTGWLDGQVALDRRGFVLTGYDPEGVDGQSPQGTTWRRSLMETSQASLPLVMSAAARPSGWLPPSAKVRWRSGWHSSGCSRPSERGGHAGHGRYEI